MGNIFSVITGIVPLIEAVVNGVEGLFGSGNGASKLQSATDASLAAIGIFAQVEGKTLPASFQADLQAAINAVVQVKNDLGLLLPHTVTPSTPAAAPAAAK
ncbi:MAG: hypothetical protein ACRD1C_03870 [Terriglobales bacterium]